MAQRIGSRSLRSLDPVRCLPPTLPSKCFVWCYGPEFVARDLRKWLTNTGAKTLYIEPGSTMGERLLRIVQLEAARRVPQRRNLLLAQGGTSAGRTMAHPLQHHPSTLFARLPIARSRDVASRDQNRVWRSGKQTALPTSPHPRRRLLELKRSCAKLTN